MKCQKCGNTVPEDSSFCPFCGGKIEVNPEVRCANCGNVLPEDSMFCHFCGTSIELRTSPDFFSEPVVKPVEVTRSASVATPNSPTNAVSPKPGKYNMTKKVALLSKPVFIAISCLCAVAIVCSCVFGCLYWKAHNIAIQNYEAWNKAQEEISLQDKEIGELEKQLSTAEGINEIRADQISQLIKEVNRYKDLYYEEFTASLFLRENIGFIVEGSDYYHNFDCSKFQNADGFWAHNIEYCEYYDYTKCPLCW